MIAHVAGAPIEEALLPLLGIGGLSTGLVVVRAWWSSPRRRPAKAGGQSRSTTSRSRAAIGSRLPSPSSWWTSLKTLAVIWT